MTTKAEAVKVAREFAQDHEGLVGRTVRSSYTPPSGYNVTFALYEVSVDNPRKVRKITSGTPGNTHFFHVPVGSVLMAKVYGQGLPQITSWVVYPHSEDLRYCDRCTPEFTLEEKLEAAEWAAEHDNTGEAYYQQEAVRSLKDQIKR